MLSPAELKAQRINTRAFVASDPTSVILTPRTRFTDGSGTRFANGNPRAPQTFKLVDQSTSSGPVRGMVQTSDGRERMVDFVLIGHHDAEIALWDIWTDAKGTWEVAELFSNQYEVRAAVIRHG